MFGRLCFWRLCLRGTIDVRGCNNLGQRPLARCRSCRDRRWKVLRRFYYPIVSRIVAVVVLLSLVATVLGYVAVNGFEEYNRRVQQIDRASSQAITGERINGLINQAVMDSRGVYMSADH